MDVILIRHVRPAMMASLRHGCTDLELVSPMDPEPSVIVEKLAVYTPYRPLASPLWRSRLTAEAMAQAAQLPVIEIDAQLTELDFGAWEGCQWDETPRVEVDHWARDLVHGNPHGGESVVGLLACVTTWAKVTTAMPMPCVWAVTHADCMRVLVMHWLQRPLIETLQWLLQWGTACGFRVLLSTLPVLLFRNR